MATTIQPPQTIPGKPVTRRPSGNGGGGNFNSGLQRLGLRDYPSSPSIGIWVVVASITMTFAALSSALIVREGAANDWRHLTLPPILYLNTLVIIASSFTLEVARRRVAAFAAGKLAKSAAALWLYVTLALGLFFVAGQYIAWLQLRAQGLYLATNPNASFFYLLTALHAIHVLGGLAGLSRVIFKLNNLTLRKRSLDATSHYWHFMDALWVYLLLLLWMKL
ncbi:MAG TPA: cytochrome c oxidase subunit 3 [Terriglobales bacterium]